MLSSEQIFEKEDNLESFNFISYKGIRNINLNLL